MRRLNREEGEIDEKSELTSIEAASMSQRKEIQMKAIIKKMLALVIIAAIGLFLAMATASADSSNSPLLRGTYAFTGSGNCVLSAGGTNLFTIIQIWEGVYIFDGHGSGSFSGTFRAVDLSSNAISKANASWEFEYEMTDHNRFETYLKPGTFDKVEDPTGVRPSDYFNIVGNFYGAVERDGASIVITSGPPQTHILCAPDPNPALGVCVPSGIEALCSESIIGLRVNE